MITVKTTLNPILTGGEDPDTSELYSNLDAKSMQGEIKAFQEWMVKKHPNFNSDGDIVIVSGVFDDGTKKAFVTYGAEYASGVNIPTGTTPSEKQKANAAKKGVFWDKAKGWIKKGQDSGLFAVAKNILGVNPATGEINYPPVTPMPNNTPPAKQDNPKTIVTVIAIAAVVGTAIWYFSNSNKKA